MLKMFYKKVMGLAHLYTKTTKKLHISYISQIYDSSLKCNH